jgi:hypothetical protein
MFKNHRGKIAKDPKENSANLRAHWHSVFNMHAEYDESVIQDIPSYDTIEYFGETPTMKEIKEAISKMKNNKAPGGTGLSMDMLKNLPNNALDFL